MSNDKIRKTLEDLWKKLKIELSLFSIFNLFTAIIIFTIISIFTRIKLQRWQDTFEGQGRLTDESSAHRGKRRVTCSRFVISLQLQLNRRARKFPTRTVVLHINDGSLKTIQNRAILLFIVCHLNHFLLFPEMRHDDVSLVSSIYETRIDQSFRLAEFIVK